MNLFKCLLAIPLMVFLWSIPTFSQESNNSITAKFLVEGGIEFGGDEILKVFFTNGEDQTMKAGQGGYFALGGQFQMTKVKPLMLRAAIGLKYNTTAAENANIRFTRVPITLIPYWNINEDIRLGIGISSHQSVRLKGDGFVPDVDFTGSFGTRVEFGYKWVALTYTSMKYTDELNKSVSANSVGISVSFTFPNK